MAVKVKVGEVYTEPKFGTGAKGTWGYVKVNADKGTDSMMVWFTNASDIPQDSYAVQIDSIEEVNLTSKNYNGKWYKNYSVNAKVSSVEGGANPINIDINGDDIPF